MTQAMWLALGWQLAGWACLVGLPPLAVFGLQWLRAQAALTATDKRGAVLKLLAQLAVTAVTYAEQTLAANPDKKAAALRFVTNYLALHGIALPLAQIDAAIESAVFTETQHVGPVTATKE